MQHPASRMAPLLALALACASSSETSSSESGGSGGSSSQGSAGGSSSSKSSRSSGGNGGASSSFVSSSSLAGSGGSSSESSSGSSAAGSGGSSSSRSDAGVDAPTDTRLSPDSRSGEPRQQASRPAIGRDACGAWAATEGVCCAQYCSDDRKSESCDKCGGPGSAQCEVVNAKACMSGLWPEVTSVSKEEPWHYSRSTHFGTAATGACAFGLYGICSSSTKLADTGLQARCDVFCKAYPDLCKDPEDITLRGNFAAPQGNYYTQFWPSLPGDLDNYLSCGECFQLMRTLPDGSEYPVGDPKYTPPIVLQIADSCPCAPNSKWCCGSGRDHCAEVEGEFKYGCPLQPLPPPPLDHDPVAGESIHFDLCDIAMARLQTGNPNGATIDGVIPTKYKRVPCPVVGNIHVWMRANAGPYYFSFTVVNMAGLGAAATVEAQLPSGDWVALQRDKNYSLSRPQERFGTWALPQGYGPFELPVTLRIADGSGKPLVAKDAIKAWAPEDKSLSENWFIDIGVQY